jgi:hypothetical protein
MTVANVEAVTVAVVTRVAVIPSEARNPERTPRLHDDAARSDGSCSGSFGCASG